MLIPWAWFSCILHSRACFAWNMLPNDSLFHFLMLSFKIFSFYWNWYIRVPLMGGNPSHHSQIFSWKSVWRSQKFSIMNGLQGFIPTFSHSRLIGQLSKLVVGSNTALNSPPATMMDSEIKKWSSRQVIPLSPTCLLFHVNIPLEVLTSIELRSSINSLNWALAGFRFHIPPFFSSRFLIKLKSPPKIHGLSSAISLIIYALPLGAHKHWS